MAMSFSFWKNAFLTHIDDMYMCAHNVQRMAKQNFKQAILSNSDNVKYNTSNHNQANKRTHKCTQKWNPIQERIFLHLAATAAAVSVQFLFVYLMVIRLSKLHLYLKLISIASHKCKHIDRLFFCYSLAGWLVNFSQLHFWPHIISFTLAILSFFFACEREIGTRAFWMFRPNNVIRRLKSCVPLRNSHFNCIFGWADVRNTMREA